MQTRDHKKLAEMFASEMSRKRIPYICKKAFIYGNIEPHQFTTFINECPFAE